MSQSRAVLLARVVDHLTSSGLSNQSLRVLASAVGSSHRMLLYHFGSYDGLVAAVVGEVEQRQRRELLRDASTDGPGPGRADAAAVGPGRFR